MQRKLVKLETSEHYFELKMTNNKFKVFRENFFCLDTIKKPKA